MAETVGPHYIVQIPPERRVVLNFQDLASGGPTMYALLEVDVTAPRQAMEAYKARTGERLSFTGYLVYCLGRAVDEDKSVQAYRKGRNQLVQFDDVDVGMMIERQFGATRVPSGYVVRRVNHKTFMEVHQEIRRVQHTQTSPRQGFPAWLRVYQALPGLVQDALNGIIRSVKRRNPVGAWVASVGTVGVTAVGMFGSGGGWGIAPVSHTLCLIVGGIVRKPVVVADRIEARDILNLTVAFDHAIVDGAPAARFVTRLVSLIESADGLDTDGLVGADAPGRSAAPVRV